MNLKNVFWGYDCIIQSFPTHNYAFICVIMSFISAGGDLTPNGIELVGDDLTCVDFARRRLRGRRFDPDSSKMAPASNECRSHVWQVIMTPAISVNDHCWFLCNSFAASISQRHSVPISHLLKTLLKHSAPVKHQYCHNITARHCTS